LESEAPVDTLAETVADVDFPTLAKKETGPGGDLSAGDRLADRLAELEVYN